MAFRQIKRGALTTIACLAIALSFPTIGCRTQPSGGSPITATPLGMAVDVANSVQEENAEPAKFIVYMHEFELNQPFEIPSEIANSEDYQGVPPEFARGFRLNPFGQDHVRRIASEVLKGMRYPVVVERSDTSKRWTTLYRFPVHWNPELDEHRRQVVVEALGALGVERASELVHIAPAFPQGRRASEAAQSNNNGRSGRGSQNGFGTNL